MIIPERDWPTREQALAIVEALGKQEAATMADLGVLAGVPDIKLTVQRCHYVFGFPQLEAAAVAASIAEV